MSDKASSWIGGSLVAAVLVFFGEYWLLQFLHILIVDVGFRVRKCLAKREMMFQC